MSSTTALNIAYLDFDTIKASLRDYLRSQTVFKDYNFEGSGLSVLLDLLAYNTHYFGFYINMVANEMFLDSANLRSSVVSLAKMLGYTTRSVTSAEATVSIVITPNNNNASAVIAKGTQFTAPINGQNYTFVTNQVYSTTIVNGVFTFPDVTLVEGVPYTYRITADSSIINQRFVIPSSTADTSTLTVQVQNSVTDTTTTTFTLATNLVTVTANSTVFFLQEVENRQYQVYFGDGIIGKAIEDGNIVILNYIVSDGTAANSASTFTPSSTVAGYQAYLTTVTTLGIAAGGLDVETIDEIKFQAPKSYETQGRAVTVNDYTTILQEQYTNLASVAVWGGETMNPPQYGKVFISMKPVDGFVLTNIVKNQVISDILLKYNIVSVIPVIVDPIYTYIKVTCIVKFDPTITSNTVGEIASKAYTAIVDFATGNLDLFNLELRYSRLCSAIDAADTSITSNLTTLQMYQILSIELNVVQNYSISFNNSIIPGSVTSSIFVEAQDPLLTIPYIDGNAYTIGDDSKGNLVMIQSGIGVATVPVRNCGTVNYTTGSIMITQITPSQAGTNASIQIIASAQQNDIVPFQNNILFIQPFDINVTAIANTTNA